MKAKNFSLLDQEGSKRTLSEFLGSIMVLYFYPKDFTSGCTREACDFRDVLGELRRLGAVVIGVSKDTTTSHARFDEKHGLGFILLSDPESKTARAYGVYGTKMMYGKQVEGVKRSTFLIGPQGDVLKAWEGVKVDGHAAEVVAAIRSHLKDG